jgi:hypothetical protein
MKSFICIALLLFRCMDAQGLMPALQASPTGHLLTNLFPGLGSLRELNSIAAAGAFLAGIALPGRDERRVPELLVGWFTKNWAALEPKLQYIKLAVDDPELAADPRGGIEFHGGAVSDAENNRLLAELETLDTRILYAAANAIAAVRGEGIPRRDMSTHVRLREWFRTKWAYTSPHLRRILCGGPSAESWGDALPSVPVLSPVEICRAEIALERACGPLLYNDLIVVIDLISSLLGLPYPPNMRRTRPICLEWIARHLGAIDPFLPLIGARYQDSRRRRDSR